MSTTANAPRRSAPAPVALRARDVADLTVASGYPCISVLLPTQPAGRMTSPDRDMLHALLADVEQRLSEHGVTNRERLLRRLSDQALRAAEQPTDRGLAIYVSLALARTFRLPQAVEARAVVEPTFATRPLVAALHRMPPHVVLLLHPTCAHLYAAADGGLRPVRTLDPFRGSSPIRLPRPGEPGAAEARDELIESFLRSVDRMLGEFRAQHPSPLVLAGADSLMARFCALSRNLERLAGRVVLDGQDTALDLALACTEAIDNYLRTRRADALAQLKQALRERPRDVASGIGDCWRSVRLRPPGMLLVEENFISPGIPDQPGGPTAKADGERSSPRHLHDLVDDLMEQVVVRGGQLALVRDGELAAHERIALISRR
jgi:hypothetical protein